MCYFVGTLMPQMRILGTKFGFILVHVAMHDEGIATVLFFVQFFNIF